MIVEGLEITADHIVSFMMCAGVFGTEDNPGSIIFPCQKWIIAALLEKEQRDRENPAATTHA